MRRAFCEMIKSLHLGPLSAPCPMSSEWPLNPAHLSLFLSRLVSLVSFHFSSSLILPDLSLPPLLPRVDASFVCQVDQRCWTNLFESLLICAQCFVNFFFGHIEPPNI